MADVDQEKLNALVAQLKTFATQEVEELIVRLDAKAGFIGIAVALQRQFIATSALMEGAVLVGSKFGITDEDLRSMLELIIDVRKKKAEAAAGAAGPDAQAAK